MPVVDVKGYGQVRFPEGMSREEMEEALRQLPAREETQFEPTPPPPPKSSAAERTERMGYGAIGAGAGALVPAISLAGQALESGSRRMEAGRIAAQRAAGMPVPEPGVESRILRGTTEEGATGRARQTGYNIQTAQEAARLREMRALEQAMQEAGGARTLGQVLAEAPGMTASKHGVVYPRTAPPPNIPTPPAPKIGPLEQVSQLFRTMMSSPIAKIAIPPLAAGSAGLDLADIVQEQRKEDPERMKQALAALGILGSGLSMIPRATPVGLGLSAAVPIAQYVREQQKFPAYPKDRVSAESPDLETITPYVAP